MAIACSVAAYVGRVGSSEGGSGAEGRVVRQKENGGEEWREERIHQVVYGEQGNQ